MDAYLEKEYYIRATDINCFGQLSVTTVLDLFQDAAGDHAVPLGVGYAAMVSRGLVWVVARTRIEITGSAAMYQKVRVCTWPHAPAGFGCLREYRMEDPGTGACIAKGDSEWLCMNMETRSAASADRIFLPEISFREERVFSERMPRIRWRDIPDTETFSVTPAFTDLDINGHVNNTKYANYILDALRPEKGTEIAALQIDYHREVMQGELLTLSLLRETSERGPAVRIKGTGGGALRFAASVLLKS